MTRVDLDTLTVRQRELLRRVKFKHDWCTARDVRASREELQDLANLGVVRSSTLGHGLLYFRAVEQEEHESVRS
jgi:hypothetical protein